MTTIIDLRSAWECNGDYQGKLYFDPEVDHKEKKQIYKPAGQLSTEDVL